MSLLLEPGNIGSLRLDHRVLMGSMHLGIEGARRNLDQVKAFYVERALGKAALITTGGAAVLPEGGGDHMFCLVNDDHCRQLEQVATAVHDAGGKIALQLFHAGRYAKSRETELPSVAPSPVASRFTGETPCEMTRAEVAKACDAFVDGALIAAKCGFNAVEIMGSEGYLLNEFLSPLTNRRNDEYGRDLTGRMKPALDVVKGIRKKLGREFPVIFRMSGDDCMEGSTTREETLEFAASLEECGVDAINTGIGWHESPLPTVANIVPPGAFAHVAASIRERVRIPVIAANRIHTPEVAEELIAKGFFDFVAPARPWLADPSFARKILDGDRKGMNICVSCNQSCLDHTLGDPPLPVGCLVNPKTGHELESNRQQSREFVGRKRRVAVVGGGVAGLEAAKTAAECGHLVTLYEAEPKLGGQFRLATLIPGKQNFLETLRYYEEMLRRLGVTVKLDTLPGADELSGFDKVIIATGVRPHFSEDIAGVNLPHVCTYADLLRGKTAIGNRVAVIGAGGIGCDVAHFLAEAARVPEQVRTFHEQYGSQVVFPRKVSITLVSRSEKVAKGVGVTTRWVLLSELKRLGVSIKRGFRCTAIEKGGVWIEGKGERSFIEADQVVLCTGQRPRGLQPVRLRESADFETVGGAYDARGLNAARAIRQAHLAALNVV